MQKTTIHLGSTKKHFVVKVKAKNKPELTGFCNSPSCLAVMQLDSKHRCMGCGNHIVRPQNYESMKKWFETFIKTNEHLLNHEVQFESNTTIPVQIKKRTYFIPIRYIVEFSNIMHTDDFIEDSYNAYSKFFDNIKNCCYSVISY